MHESGTSRGAFVAGALLIVLGAAALVVRVSGVNIGWPVWVILPGLALLVAAFALPEPGGSGLAAAGGIVTAVGTLLAVQDATGTYASWAYAWALVAPGGVGVGLLLYGLLTRRGDIARGGLASLITGIVLFLVGFLFFEGLLHLNGDRFAGLTSLSVPIVIMGIGAAVLVGAIIPGPWRRRSRPSAPGATAWTAGGSWTPPVSAAAPNAGGTAQALALALEGAADAEVRIAFGAGKLLVGPAASGLLVDGTFEGGVNATPAGAGRVRLTTPHPASWSWDWGRAPFDWRLGLTAEVPLRLEVETGASDNELDLSGLHVTDLRIRTGAAQSRVTLPATGVTRVNAEGGAAQMRFRVPAGVAARITSTMAIGTTDVDTTRFPRTRDGAAWASPDFDANPNRAEIAVRGGVGQVTIG
ncbi:MAG TPA: hypothetical protein VIK16_02515 [Candidatus Limnocylindrales bacterium]